MAVSPFLSTAFTSAPRVRRYSAAASASGSVPASSSGARQPIPAAAMSGVHPSLFASRQSAPSSTSSFMYGRSAVWVAPAVRLAAPGQGVQGGEPRPLVVGVRPRLDQLQGQLEVPVLDRQG